jgi:hypothetical protein
MEQRWNHERRYKWTTRLILGSVSGLAASGMMSVYMNLTHRLLPREQKYHLPPKEITLALAARAGMSDEISEEPVKTMATGAGHFGYGALGGILFSMGFPRLQINPLIAGSLFGFLYWTIGYLGWIPATGILSPATRHPPQRALLTLTAHLVYGLGAAYIFNFLKRNKR